jgi:hypothetical protein
MSDDSKETAVPNVRVVHGYGTQGGGHSSNPAAAQAEGTGWGEAPSSSDCKPLKRPHASEKPENLLGVH